MKYLQLNLILLFIASAGLYAGHTKTVKENDYAFTKLNVTVAVKISEKDKDQHDITVKMKADKINSLKLFTGKKLKKLNPESKDGFFTVNINVDKKELSSSFLLFSGSGLSKTKCKTHFKLNFADFLKQQVTK